MKAIQEPGERAGASVATWALALTLLSVYTTAEEFPAVDCVISPYQVVDLASPVPGVIERVLVERSDLVTRDQVVAQLASGVERAAVALARARAQVEPEINVWQVNLQFDEKRKARVHSLHDSKVVSDDNRDEADLEAELSGLKLQQAMDLKTIRQLELERAEEQLKQKTIRSPIDGFVLAKHKSPGEYVEEQAIVRIAQLDPLHVDAIVPIELYGKIPVGLAAEVHPETLSAETRSARVTVVDRSGDAGSGTFGVRLEMPNPGYELPAGLKCELRFLKGTVAAIPPSSALPDAGDAVAMSTAASGRASPAASVDETPTETREPIERTPPVVAQVSTVGPIHSEAELARMVEVLGKAGVKYDVRQDVGKEIGGHIVLSRVIPDFDEAIERDLAMRRDGIVDLMLDRGGEYKGRVSAGIYDTSPWAERRKAGLQDRGYESEVIEQTRDTYVWWVDVHVPGQADRTSEIQGLLSQIEDGAP